MAATSTLEAISDEEPCGQDLDLEEDGAYLQFMAGTDAVLPDSYMQEEDGKRVPFYAAQRYLTLDLAALVGSGTKLLARSHDLRLMAVVAKLHILNRSLPRFGALIDSMAALLETFPKEVHPQAAEERAGALERLNDPLILSALNNSVLFKSRRLGSVTWVSYVAATRADDGAGGTEGVDRVLREEVKADPSSIEDAQTTLGGLLQALGRIAAASAAFAPAAVPDLQKLTGQLNAILAMMQRVHPSADTPAPAAEGTEGHGAAASGLAQAQGALSPGATLPLLPNAEAADAALAEAERFFAAVEPSSPCLLLLRQAQALVGKSFFAALQALVPDSVDKAVFQFGATPPFDLPLRRMVPADGGEAAVDPEKARTMPGPRPFGAVTSRAEALSLLDQVSAFYRFVEPSSPIPLLVDRARALAGKDFASLLKAMLPEKAEGSSSW